MDSLWAGIVGQTYEIDIEALERGEIRFVSVPAKTGDSAGDSGNGKFQIVSVDYEKKTFTIKKV